MMRKWIAPLPAVALAVAANLNILRNGYVYDDGSQILHNPWLKEPWTFALLLRIFSTNVWGFLGADGISNYYRPLMHLLNWACFHLFAFQPWGYHLTSILLHAICTLMVFAITREIGLPSLALWTAMLFAVHPIHTEAIAWIAANTELGFTMFVLLAFYLHIRGVRRWAMVAFLAALLMKETAIVFLVLAAAWEGKRYIRIWVYALPLAIYFPLRIHALGGLTMQSNGLAMLPEQQVLSVFYLLGKYFGKLIDPVPFNIFYVFHPVNSVSDPRFIAGFAAVIAALAAGYWLWRRQSKLWLAVLWVLAPLAPALWISRVGDNVFTERYLYLPSVGFCWLVAWMIVRAPQFIGRVPLAPCLGAVLVVWYGFVTVQRNVEWHDDFVLYEKTLEVEPDASLVRGYLANAYLLTNSPERALLLFQQVVREKPLDASMQIAYGTTLLRLSRYKDARMAYERARALRPGEAVPWYNLGVVAETEGRRADAEQNYRQALLRDPKYVEAHRSLAVLLLEDGKFPEAELHFRAAGSMAGLGRLLLMMGRSTEAEKAFRDAIAQDPNNAEAFYLLGTLERDTGRRADADASFREMRRVLPWSSWKPPLDAKY